jgi:chromosome segregation ATPase
MSFDLSRGARARSSAEPFIGDPTDSDADLEKLQEAIREIQQLVAEIKRCSIVLNAELGSRARRPKPSRTFLQSSVSDARRRANEAHSALEEHAQVADGLPTKRLKRQKLMENLATAQEELQMVWRAYEVAEAEWEKAHMKNDADCNAGKSSLTACSGVLDAQEMAADLETGQVDVQIQELGSVSQGDVDIHTAVIDEYAADVTRMNADVRCLQRIMLDLHGMARQQGEALDSIEANFRCASENQSRAVEQLAKTNARSLKSMKRVHCFLATGVVTAIATIALILSRG